MKHFIHNEYMENTAPLPDSFVSQQNTSILIPEKKKPYLALTIAGFIVTAALAGGVGYYFGSLQKVPPAGEIKPGEQILVPPTEMGVACTLEAKICPDGSAVGRSGPKCEFAACPTTSSTSMKLYTSPNFPGEFKVPENTYIADQKVQDGSFQVFISSGPISIPEMWDSPFSPINIRVINNSTNEDNYDKQVTLIKSLYEQNTLVITPISMGKTNGMIVSGTFAEGYGSGEKISQAIFKTQKGYVLFYYYPFVDTNFSHEKFIEIVKSVEIK